MQPIEFRSDNTATITPHILEAIVSANSGSALGYGGDDLTAGLHGLVSEIFEREAFVFPVGSGTAANSLGLSAMCPPWGAILCTDDAHILTHEAAGPSLFSGGAAIQGLRAADARLAAETLRDALDNAGWGDPHHSQPAVLSISQTTELGTVYAPERIAELASIAAERGLTTHLDGSRLANALAATGASPAEMVSLAGVTTLSLGGIKNGTMSADAIVTFDPEIAHQLRFRLKRSGHTSSKMRFLSAQLIAYLQAGRWIETAAHANRTMARLAAGLRELGHPASPEPAANIGFVTAPAAVIDSWADAGLVFYRMSATSMRFVTSFQTTDAEVDEALARIARASG